MHTLKRFLLTLLPLLTIATPTEDAKGSGITISLSKRGGFLGASGHADLLRLNSHVFRTTDKIVRGLETYKANEGIEHPSLSVDSEAHSRLAKRAVVRGGVVPLHSSRDMLWYGEFKVGTPPKAFATDFDTGSSDIFMPGVNCIDKNCDDHNKYDSRQSSTASALGGNVTLRYGDGSAVQVSRYNDTLTIANVACRNQTFGVASAYNEGFSADKFIPDGIFGLAWQRLSVIGAEPFMQRASNQLGIPATFALMISATRNGKSQLTLGDIRPSGCTGNITWFGIEEEAYWQVNVDSIGAQGAEFPVGPVKAVFDSGTTMMLGDERSVTQFYSGILGAKPIGDGYFSVPCDSIPPIHMRLGGYTVTITPDDFSMGKIANTTDCVGGVVGSPVLKFWIVGDTGMKAVCTFFDYDQKRLGMSERA